MEGFKGKKIPQIHVNEHLLDDICFHKSIPFFSGTSSTTRKHNRNLEPFFRPRDLTLQLWMRSFRYTWPGTVNWYNTTMFTLKWKLPEYQAFLRGLGREDFRSLPFFPFSPRNAWYSGYKILYRKNYCNKKGSKSFQQKRKMFSRKFGWTSMKVLQINGTQT